MANINTQTYLDRAVCDSIKGLFILTVFYSHILPYLRREGIIIDNYLSYAIGWMGQLIVVMFLFYSGYGVMYSIKKKGVDYVTSMPKNRLLTTLLNFMVAVTLFLVLQTLVLSKTYEISHVLLSFIGWESVGNSNWYIFIILLCYLCTYLIFNNLRGGVYIRLWMTVFMIAMLIIPLMVLKESWWYDTIMAYPLGMIWCVYKDRIDKFVVKYYLLLLLCALFTLAAYHYFPYKPFPGILHNFRSVVFAIFVLMITMAFPIKSTILVWLGKNLFPLYIYQRIPMIFLSSFDGGEWMKANPYLYIFVCLLTTFFIVYLYRFFEIKIKSPQLVHVQG